MKHRRTLPWLLFLAVPAATASAFGACSADSEDDPSSGASGPVGPSGPGSGGEGTGASGGNGGVEIDAGERDGDLTRDAACASASAEATLTKRPIDIVFIVDNSGSMGDDILKVQDNINGNFASIIGAAGVDFRVIMVSLHGWSDTAEAICIKAPLSSVTCNPIPAQPGNHPPIFFHYSTQIESQDGICKLLSAFDGTLADDFGLAPMGWSEWLRPDTFKVFTIVTDDRIACGSYDDFNIESQGIVAAGDIDADLMALSPTHFGDAQNRNYVWHSIQGIVANSPPSDPWLPQDPIQLGTCNTAQGPAPAPGTGYQALSILTGGLRFPICEHASYGPVFQAIANSAIDASIACEFALPEPPPGETIDLTTVEVEYTPGGGGQKKTFGQVQNFSFCNPDSFYIEDGQVKLCPTACDVVQLDPEAKLVVLYDCENITP